VRNPVTNYRFLLELTDGSTQWLTALGIVAHDPTDRFDFRVVTYAPPPDWLFDAVCYQIFPDRFANTGVAASHGPWPGWAIPARWDEPVLADPRDGVRQMYGGDLPGIEAHLDHVERLGANLIYLTPVFPAHSNHRYNASSFHRVDPFLGGDEALASLTEACHRRGIRVIGDLTANHCGDTHEWFLAARADPAAPEANFFFWRHHPDDYEAWWGVRSLPKFDHRDGELRRRLYDGPDSVVARWLRPPWSLDGWRVDVANMAARRGDIDLNAELARAMRRTMAMVAPDAYLLAEHAHDASPDLLGDGWHGTMNYGGFTRPAWCFLGGARPDLHFLGQPGPVPRRSGHAVIATMREFMAAVPWRTTTANMNLLDSHDTTRLRTVTGSSALTAVGHEWLMAFPGVPTLFAGDEIGTEGDDSNDARKPMRWDEGTWDLALFERTRRSVCVRRSSAALRRGGLRWAHAGDDSLTFLRETADERVLVHVARARHESVRIPSTLLGMGSDGFETLIGERPLDVDGDDVVIPGESAGVGVWRIS
jgi:alpha-glucosidase